MNEIHQIANLTISQAAELMGVSVSTVKRRVRHDELPFYRLGNRTKFSVADIETWQRQYRHVQTEEPEMVTAKRAVEIVRSVR